MKPTNFLSMLMLVCLTACTSAPKVETTVNTELGDFTPYNVMPEYLFGQVKSVVELNYWGLQQGDEFVKGEVINKQERDSIYWTYDFEVFFTNDGLPRLVNNIVDNKINGSWKLQVEEGKIKRAEYYVNDTLKKYGLLKYDEAGCLVKQKTFKAKDTVPTSIYIFECNENIKWVQGFAKSPEGEFKGKYKLDRNTDNTVAVFYVLAENDSVKSKSIQVYDENGFYTKMKSYDGKDSLLTAVTMEYLSYDEMGNWTSAKAVMDDTHIIYTERKYEYYNE